MIKTLPITKAREELTKLVDRAHKHLDEYIITVKGVPAAILMSPAKYDSLEETMEIVSDPKLMKAIKEAEEDVKAGRVYDWEDIKKELELGVQNKDYPTS